MPESKTVSEIHDAITEGVAGLYALLQRTVEDNKEQALIVRQVSESVKDIAQEVANLAKVLVVGNGQPAITVRTALIEQSAKEAKDDIEQLKTLIEGQRTVSDGKRWQTVLLFCTSFSSLVIALVSSILSAWLRHP